MTDILPSIAEHGVIAGMLMLFVWWAWTREKEQTKRHDALQTEIRQNLVAQVERSTAAINQSTEVLQQSTAVLNKVVDIVSRIDQEVRR